MMQQTLISGLGHNSELTRPNPHPPHGKFRFPWGRHTVNKQIQKTTSAHDTISAVKKIKSGNRLAHDGGDISLFAKGW